MDNPSVINTYWDYHTGLVTNKMHCEEMERIFELPEKPQAVVSLEDYSKLLEENEFLYKHFEGEVRVDEEGIRHRDWQISEISRERDELRMQRDWQISEISRERDELRKQRDYLQYVIDETRKSITYKIARLITWLPRKIRGDK